MFVTEPIVLVLSLLSGFSDGLIFIFIQSFSLVYAQWDFKAYQVGLAFIPLGLGYILAFISFIFSSKRNVRRRQLYPDDERVQFEERMWWLLFTAPMLPIGLITFAWTSGGPPIHWIGSMICASLVGIANFSIYMATIDYMITAYGPYSASATGGNGWSRDILAGILTVPAVPFFTNIGPSKNGEKHWHHLQYASTILACIAFLLVSAVYVIYWKGPLLRTRSPFAQQLSSERKAEREHMSSAGHPIGPTASRQSRTTPKTEKTEPVYQPDAHTGTGTGVGSEADAEKREAPDTHPTTSAPSSSPATHMTPGKSSAGAQTDPEKAAAPGMPTRPGLPHRHSTARAMQESRVRPGLATRRSSYMASGIPPNERSRTASRNPSRNPSRGASRNPSRAPSVEDVSAAASGHGDASRDEPRTPGAAAMTPGEEHGSASGAPYSFAERLQARLMRPGLGSRHNTHASVASGLGELREGAETATGTGTGKEQA